MVRRVKFRPPIAGGDNNGLHYRIVFDRSDTVKRIRSIWTDNEIDLTVYTMAIHSDI